MKKLKTKIKTVSPERLVVRLIEDEIESGMYIEVDGFFKEKNCINEEYTHSYFARVLQTGENNKGLKENDIVFLNKQYSRNIFCYDDELPFFIVGMSAVIAKVKNFSVENMLSEKGFQIEPLMNYALVENIKSEAEVQQGGFTLPEIGVREQKFAKVLALGNEVKDFNKGVEIDDYVLVFADAGSYVTVDGRKLVIINSGFLISKIKDFYEKEVNGQRVLASDKPVVARYMLETSRPTNKPVEQV